MNDEVVEPMVEDPRAAGGRSAVAGDEESVLAEAVTPVEDEVETSVEDLLDTVEQVTAERDRYLELVQRTQAEFENYKKRVTKQQAAQAAREAESLVEQLLPVLDAFDGALVHEAEGIRPLFNSFSEVLVRRGLERIGEVGEDFDPNQHEAVMHEPSEEDGGPVVAEVMRAGYFFNGRVLRPAMVRVRG